MRSPLAERARGRWSSILPLVGLDRICLGGKHTPCPMCGGRDRFRYINREGSGDWICNQCGHGSGTDLVMRFLKIDFKAAAERIEAVIGSAEVDHVKAKRSDKANRADMRGLWNRAQSIMPGSPGARYLRETRGLDILEFPSCLRFAPDCPYEDFPGGQRHPAIVAKVISAQNDAVNLHRIFVTPDGRKSPLDPARKLMRGTLPPGAAVRLQPPGKTLGVSTGIETSLAAQQLFSVPVWATLVDGGLERFVIPEGVEELLIFGDRDKSYSGQKAAYALANRAVVRNHIRADVLIPDKAKDWNDIVMFHMERSAA